MPHERRKLHEVIRRIAAISIPSEQSTDRKAVAQVVDMRWRSARRDRDVQLRDQGMEYNADRAWVHRSAADEREYRRVGRCAGHLYRSSVHEGVETCGQARPHGNQPGLGEFCLADDQNIPIAVDVSPTQSSNLPNAQPEAEEQAKDRRISRAAERRGAPIGKPSGQVDKPLGCSQVQNTRRTWLASSA